jgi:2-C-methyl-D-erythritol 2,4-cyclodiphosphate synthase
MRIGYGWDSHEFKKGVPLKIGGHEIPHPKGLGGHSDGDVLLHAITDAMLGAIAAPDIGTLFSPSDPRWKGAESSVFVTEAMWRVKAAGYAIVNVDSTLIMAQPKIGPHTANIRAKISALIGIPPDRIGIKAKTPEGLGIQNTAIAHAVVLMAKESGPRRRAKKKSRS